MYLLHPNVASGITTSKKSDEITLTIALEHTLPMKIQHHMNTIAYMNITFTGCREWDKRRGVCVSTREAFVSQAVELLGSQIKIPSGSELTWQQIKSPQLQALAYTIKCGIKRSVFLKCLMTQGAGFP